VESIKQDKRSIVRRRTQQLVYLELGKENGGVMLNLSEEGCGFQAITPVKCGETRFGFQINGGRRIAGDAEIVWADDSGVMGGLRFLNLPAEAHKEIRLWLAETNAPVEGAYGSAAAASFDGASARRTRAAGVDAHFAPGSVPGSMPGSVPGAGVRAAVEEPPVPPPWTNFRANDFPVPEDDRYRMPYGRDDLSFGDPHRKSAAIWRGIASVATLVALAVVVIMYQHDIGTSLIWIGESLSGKTKASATVPEKPAASAAPALPAENSPANPGTNSPASPTDDKNSASQDLRNAGATPQKELATTGHPDAPAGVPDSGGLASNATTGVGGAHTESVLERQGVAQKPEPVWSEGDSVESLWGAVQSGSVSAEVSLAERFARGAGVSKNCDQAKVLMKAAADHGNKEARLRLYQMETDGCH
jgi:hypothetical protein